MIGSVLLGLLGGDASLARDFPTLRTRAQALRGAFEAASAATGVPAALLYGIAAQESSLRADAVNPVERSCGLMQIHPVNWPRFPAACSSPAANVLAGAVLLRDYVERERGNLKRAIARYNGAATYLRGEPQPVFESYYRRVLSFTVLFQFGG